ncbi:MAG: hypothetical protein CK425_11115 [Parachlamydia sp.]|nr:MAG: hypothetical protein CK425_11115 [Parachlamydia sp.]
MKKLSFTSSSLQKINSEADLIISSHLQDLDRISNDIKALEERLKGAGIPFNFLFVLSSESRRCAYATRSHGCPIAELIEYTNNCLAWGKTKDGEFRLCHSVYITQNEIEEYHCDEGSFEKEIERGEPMLSASKPLIETKSNFRLKIENELPFFYRMILDALKKERDQENVVKYSPNYIRPISLIKDYEPLPF